jgi:hypothetical protein
MGIYGPPKLTGIRDMRSEMTAHLTPPPDIASAASFPMFAA